jgi:hypothetical protein
MRWRICYLPSARRPLLVRFQDCPGKLSNYESKPLKSMVILENFVAATCEFHTPLNFSKRYRREEALAQFKIF